MDENVPKKVVEVEFTEQQVELIDRLSEEWEVSRETAVARAVQEFVEGRHRDERSKG